MRAWPVRLFTHPNPFAVKPLSFYNYRCSRYARACAFGDHVARNFRLNVEQLIGLANARGVDLVRAAGAATETHGIARQRPRTPLEVKLGIDVKKTVNGHETRVYRRPAWSIAELAQAAVAGGVHGVRWTALRYSVIGDLSSVDELQGALGRQACEIGRRERWPPRVMGLDGQPHFFRERLAELVLLADAHRHYFDAAPALHAAIMDVTPAVWDKTLHAPFRSLKMHYEGWVGAAIAGIRRGLRGD